jgi:GT2 family glycosyltransferase
VTLPTVSIVFLAYNREAALTESLRRMLDESGYPAESLEVLVVDNASTDGTAEVVQRDFGDRVTLICNPENVGAPGWNAGLSRATGDYVLILDDDAYLRAGVLEQAVRAAEDERAGLVSFSVVSSFDEQHRLNDDWNTGLLSFWGCAALLSAPALQAVCGYDPEIFIWANEVELTIRLLDAGFTHLYLPDLEAIHMKEAIVEFEPRRYLVNARHHSYIAAKLLRPADALRTVGSIVGQAAIDAIKQDRVALTAIGEAGRGFVHGLRRRQPVRPAVSSTYRRNFHPFVSPARFMRTPADRIRALRSSGADDQRERRFATFYDEREAYYPTARASLTL